jgi:sentrin-specific protease 8
MSASGAARAAAAAPRQARDDPRVLSYHDVLLRRSDVDLLEGDHWLNDQVNWLGWVGRAAAAVALNATRARCFCCSRAFLAPSSSYRNTLHPLLPQRTRTRSQIISFWFDYLIRDAYPQLQAAVALVPPPTAFLLVHTDPPTALELLAPLALHRRALVLLPVTDNADVGHAGGGSHWSLLMFHRALNAFLHFDSAGGGGNRRPAMGLAGAVLPLLQVGPTAAAAAAAAEADRGGGGGETQQPSFGLWRDSPQQTNGHDCGVYVCAMARQMCEWWQQQIDEQQRGAASNTGQQPGHEPPEAADSQQQQQQPAGAAAAAGAAPPQGPLFLQRLPELSRRVTPGLVAALRREMGDVIHQLAAAEGGGGGGEGG